MHVLHAYGCAKEGQKVKQTYPVALDADSAHSGAVRPSRFAHFQAAPSSQGDSPGRRQFLPGPLSSPNPAPNSPGPNLPGPLSSPNPAPNSPGPNLRTQ